MPCDIRKFILEETRSSEGLIVDARGRTVATAGLLGVPSRWSRLLGAGWEALQHPRHASKHACARLGGESAPLRWEQLLQPRDKNKR